VENILEIPQTKTAVREEKREAVSWQV